MSFPVSEAKWDIFCTVYSYQRYASPEYSGAKELQRAL
jgi:hypothetical protein